MESVSRPKGTSNLEFFREVIREEGLGELLDLASYPLMAFGVIESGGKRSGVIFHHQWNPSGSYYNYWYDLRLESESMHWGSQYYRCPERILEQLSPVEELDFVDYEQENALKFRAKSREYNRAQAEKPKPKKGQVVLFNDPYLIDNMPVYAFEFLGKSTFRIPEDRSGRQWRLISWRRREFSVQEQQSSALADALDI